MRVGSERWGSREREIGGSGEREMVGVDSERWGSERWGSKRWGSREREIGGVDSERWEQWRVRDGRVECERWGS